MPQIRMRDASGTLRTITRIRMRDAGGTLRTIQRVRMRDAGGTLRTVFTYLTVALDTYNAHGTDSGPLFTGSVTTPSVTATPTGGTAPYTYLWEIVDPMINLDDACIDSPTAATTTFTDTAAEGYSREGYAKVTVTDANGSTVQSDPVAVSMLWYYVP